MAASMSPKENYLACLNHKPHEYTPGPTDITSVGTFVPWERGKDGAGTDAFGVNWVRPASGGPLGALPVPDEFLLTDVTQWKQVVQFTPPSVYDIEGQAARELANVDRDKVAVWVGSLNFIFERMAALMGFEGCLIAMAEEPEASYELLGALTDWKIEYLKALIKYYHLDIYAYHDDVATERALFMSPDCYRALIQPHHARMATFCRENGVIPIQHTCGKSDAIVQEMIDEGNAGWSAVQATNNIEEIIVKHGHEFVIVGGFNSNGPPGQPGATEEMVRADVRRCMEDFGKYGKGYIFSGTWLAETNPNNPMDLGPMTPIMIDEFLKCRAEQLA